MSRDELIELARRQDTQISSMASQISELLEVNKQLVAQLARLEHLLSRNSANSSLPPSKDDDPGKTPPPVKPKRSGGSRRKRGKQPGASGANLAWTDNPTKQVDRFPQGHCECGHDLAGAAELGVVDRYQRHEIPQMTVTVTVTQYDQHQVRCGCGQFHTAERPEGARSGLVG